MNKSAGDSRDYMMLVMQTQDDGYRIRPTQGSDAQKIQQLLRQAGFGYAALEWWTIEEWLDSPTFLVAVDRRDRPKALVLAVADGSPVAWLRAVAAESEKYLPALLQASLRAASTQGSDAVACLCNRVWLAQQLQRAGLTQVNQVITLRHKRARLTHKVTSPELDVRVATPADMDAIAAVDHAAFEPMWWYSRNVLARCLGMACCFHVAYMDEECVGYQFSTLRSGRGHIVRLAIHPRWQKMGLGSQLLDKALLTLAQARADEITVNTQVNNLQSLRLYRKFGFEPTGEAWPVWWKSLERV